jgi:integrase
VIFRRRNDLDRKNQLISSRFSYLCSSFDYSRIFDFEHQQLLVQRSIVNGRVGDVKTEYSRDHVPLHESLVEVLLEWSKQALPTEEGWVFASPLTDRPYQPTEIQKRHLRPAGWCLVECPKCGVGSGVWCRQDRPTPNGARLDGAQADESERLKP